MEGALPALRRFKLITVHTPDVLSKLAHALKGGILPLLEHFHVRQCTVFSRDIDLLSDMVEARAQIPRCKPFVVFEGAYESSNYGSAERTAARIRLLRALVPSLKELPRLEWDPAYEALFHELHPPHLEALRILLTTNAVLYPSSEVLKTMPSLKTIDYFFNVRQNTLGATPFQPVITALQRGVRMKALQEVELYYCKIGDVKFGEFLSALESSGCADGMTVLSFDNCGIYDGGARALARLLRRDGLPALEKLRLSSSRGISDGGVVALAKALEEAPRTLLVELNLGYMDMGDLGIAAAASLIHKGRLRRLQKLDLSCKTGVTNKTIVDLSLAIGERRLFKLRKFRLGTSYNGLPLLTESLAKNCLELTELSLSYGNNKDETAWLKEGLMRSLRDAGRTPTVYVQQQHYY